MIILDLFGMFWSILLLVKINADYNCNDFMTDGQMSIIANTYTRKYAGELAESVSVKEMEKRISTFCGYTPKYLEVLKYENLFNPNRHPNAPQFSCISRATSYSLEDAERLCDNLYLLGDGDTFNEDQDSEYIRQEIATYSSIIFCNPFQLGISEGCKDMKSKADDCEVFINDSNCQSILTNVYNRCGIIHQVFEGLTDYLCLTEESLREDEDDTEEERESRRKYNESKKSKEKQMKLFHEVYNQLKGDDFSQIASIFTKSVIDMEAFNNDHEFYRVIPCRFYGMIGYHDGLLSITLPCEPFQTMQLAERFLRANYRVDGSNQYRINTIKFIGAKLRRAPIILSSSNYRLHKDIRHLDLSYNLIEDFHFLLNMPNLRNLSIGKQFTRKGRSSAPLRILMPMKPRIEKLEIPGMNIKMADLYEFLEKNNSLKLLTADCEVFTDKRIIDEICYGSTKNSEFYCYDSTLEKEIINVKNSRNPCQGGHESVINMLTQIIMMMSFMIFWIIVVCLIRCIISQIGRDKLAYPMNEMEYEIKNRYRVAGFADDEIEKLIKEYHGFMADHISREIRLAEQLSNELYKVIVNNEPHLKSIRNKEQMLLYTTAEQIRLNRKLSRVKCCNIIPCPCWH